MFLTEPILICISFYTSFVYGIPFMVFQFFPIVFYEQRGWGPVISTLPFLSILIGSIFGTAINFAVQPWYVKAVKKNDGRAVPEARLPPIVIGAGLLSTGLFWFGWTASPKISWVSPTVAGGNLPLFYEPW
jgi:DHA1 family multidrug resistance protein-like MFS transporter